MCVKIVSEIWPATLYIVTQNHLLRSNGVKVFNTKIFTMVVKYENFADFKHNLVSSFSIEATGGFIVIDVVHYLWALSELLVFTATEVVVVYIF